MERKTEPVVINNRELKNAFVDVYKYLEANQKAVVGDVLNTLLEKFFYSNKGMRGKTSADRFIYNDRGQVLAALDTHYNQWYINAEVVGDKGSAFPTSAVKTFAKKTNAAGGIRSELFSNSHSSWLSMIADHKKAVAAHQKAMVEAQKAGMKTFQELDAYCEEHEINTKPDTLLPYSESNNQYDRKVYYTPVIADEDKGISSREECLKLLTKNLGINLL